MPCESGNDHQAGIWVTRQYKLHRPTSKTNFICLSGMGRDHLTIRLCKDAGFIPPFALGKPFNLDELIEVLKIVFPSDIVIH